MTVVGETGEGYGELTFFTPDGTIATLERLVEDPNSHPCCMYDGTAADLVFFTSNGTACHLDARISPLCAAHIGKETQDPMVAVVELTGFGWGQRFGYEPLVNRQNLDTYKEALEAELDPEDFAELFPSEVTRPPTGWRRVFGRVIRSIGHG